MICSIPLKRGFAYFEASTPDRRLVALSKDSFGLPLELATPLLPLDARGVGVGGLAIGVICYCQTDAQAQAIRSLPPLPVNLTAPAPQTCRIEISLFDALIRGIITTILVKAILK